MARARMTRDLIYQFMVSKFSHTLDYMPGEVMFTYECLLTGEERIWSMYEERMRHALQTYSAVHWKLHLVWRTQLLSLTRCRWSPCNAIRCGWPGSYPWLSESNSTTHRAVDMSCGGRCCHSYDWET
jgi:hypothetical protein